MKAGDLVEIYEPGSYIKKTHTGIVVEKDGDLFIDEYGKMKDPESLDFKIVGNLSKDFS